MKKIIMAVVLIGFNACTNQKNQNSQQPNIDSIATDTKKDMKNLVSIVEIPTKDFQRAITFYQEILDIKIETADMDGIKMGLFPSSGDGVFVQLINGEEYKPSVDGTTIYLNGGNDLQVVVEKIQAHGGQLLVPKTSIAPDMGYFAIFTDTEGNKLGIHSPH